MGLLCARQYFDRDTPAERRLRQDITNLWGEAEWNWYTQGGRKLLYWHWSPNNGWALDHEIHGWNECLITYVMAAASPRYPVEADVYHRGFAAGRDFLNGKALLRHRAAARHGRMAARSSSRTIPSCGLDPRGLKDRYADYWEQNVAHVRINREHCVAQSRTATRATVPTCWGLTASDDPERLCRARAGQ